MCYLHQNAVQQPCNVILNGLKFRGVLTLNQNDLFCWQKCQRDKGCIDAKVKSRNVVAVSTWPTETLCSLYYKTMVISQSHHTREGFSNNFEIFSMTMIFLFQIAYIHITMYFLRTVTFSMVFLDGTWAWPCNAC